MVEDCLPLRTGGAVPAAATAAAEVMVKTAPPPPTASDRRCCRRPWEAAVRSQERERSQAGEHAHPRRNVFIGARPSTKKRFSFPTKANSFIPTKANVFHWPLSGSLRRLVYRRRRCGWGD